MSNFDLKKYLAEGRIFEEEIPPIFNMMEGSINMEDLQTFKSTLKRIKEEKKIILPKKKPTELHTK